MKRILLFLLMSIPFLALAQEAEQSIPADSYSREGGTMIITFSIPKTDVQVDLRYNVKDLFFQVNGQNNRAMTYSGETREIAPGRHTIYWEIGQDAPDLYNVQQIYIVAAFTPETYTRVEEWKQRQYQQEQERILNEIREQERRRIQDSIRRANQYKPQPKPVIEESSWKRPYARTQFGIVGSLGSGFTVIDSKVDGIEHKSKLFDSNALSWQAGAVLRTHFTKWLGIQTGAIYSVHKFAEEVTFLGETNTAYYQFKYIQVPATLHLYLGKKLNFFAGYNYQFRSEGFVYDKDGEKIGDKFDEDSYKKSSGGIILGGELRGNHSALSVSYQKDSETLWEGTGRGSAIHGAWWASFTIFF